MSWTAQTRWGREHGWELRYYDDVSSWFIAGLKDGREYWDAATYAEVTLWQALPDRLTRVSMKVVENGGRS